MEQPVFTIGLVGHVDHGKTTLVQSLSGKWTDTHSEEIKRGITIRLGYADVALYKCSSCAGIEAFGIKNECSCGKQRELVRVVSLVDAPGHESLMATMLSGANIMDCALLLVSANESCPQPQTMEHLKALEIMGQKNVIIVQNKLDLVTDEQVKKNFNEIKEFVKDTPYQNSPVIPLSALHNINIDALVEEVLKIPVPERDVSKNPVMYVARSFDINRPGTKVSGLSGGILGGVLVQGVLKKGDEIELLPGYDTEEKNQKVWKPLRTVAKGLMTGGREVKEVFPGGTFAVLTGLDPSIVKSDKLSGSVVGHVGKLPPVWYECVIEAHLLQRIVGAKDKLVVEPIKLSEFLMLNVNSSATVGVVKEIHKAAIKVVLRRPVCAEKGSRMAISRNIGQRWRLIGYGILG